MDPLAPDPIQGRVVDVTKAVVSVLLLTKNAGPRLDRVLNSVLAQRKVEFDVLAVDSGSTDRTLEMLQRFGVQFHQIPSDTFSHGGTRNRIASLATGSLLAFLSQDAVPLGTTWLASLVHAFTDANLAGAFGRQLPRPGVRESESYFQSVLYPSTPRRMLLNPGDRYRIGDFFFSNANSMLRKSVWEQIPFPDHVVMSEDQWWAREVLQRGYELAYVPDAAVEHSHDHGAIALFRRNFDSGASLRGLDESSPLERMARAITYVNGEYRFLSRRGKSLAFPRALGRELVRAAGLVMGANVRLIPRPARTKLSMHSYHWT